MTKKQIDYVTCVIGALALMTGMSCSQIYHKLHAVALDLLNIKNTTMDKATRILRDMKYARIIELIAEKQRISLEEAMDMLYSSPLFEIIDDGTADLICRSDIYLADEIIRAHDHS